LLGRVDQVPELPAHYLDASDDAVNDRLVNHCSQSRPVLAARISCRARRTSMGRETSSRSSSRGPFRKISRQARIGQVRVLHKPLLLLWLFGRFAATGSSVASYRQAEEPGSQLISDFGPLVASPAAAGGGRRCRSSTDRKRVPSHLTIRHNRR
jgi:hypothetical protein